MRPEPTGSPPQTCKRPRKDPGAPDQIQALAKAAAQPPNTEVSAVHIVNHDGDAAAQVAVDLGVLRVAADLIATQHEREAEAFRRGQVAGFSHGWRCGLEAGIERGRAA